MDLRNTETTHYATRNETQGYVKGGHKETHDSAPTAFEALCAKYGWSKDE